MHPEAARRLFDLLESALPGDARAVLAGLGDPVVAAAIAGARTLPPPRVVDFVFDEAGPLSLVALAERLAASSERADAGLCRRILRRCDPAADEALFGFGARRPRRWVRRAVLRDRRGPDGRPVIAGGLRTRLLAAATRGDDEVLLRDLARADDPELVLAALARLVWRPQEDMGPARAMLTLAEHGQLGGVAWPAVLRHPDGGRFTVEELRGSLLLGGAAQDWIGDGTLPEGRDSVWQSNDVGLWRYEPASWEPLVDAAAAHGRAGEGVGLRRAMRRDDLPITVRRRVAAHFPFAVAHVPDPGAEDLAFTVGMLEKHAARDEPLDTYLHTLLDTGMRRGTLTAAEVLGLTRPAAAVVAWTGAPGVTAGSGTAARGTDRRGRADVRALIVALVRDELGGRDHAWTQLLLAVGLWPGTLPELVRLVATDRLAGVSRTEPAGTGRSAWHGRRGRPAERLLFGMAGTDTVERLLSPEPDGARRMALAEVLRRGPTHRGLAEYALRLPNGADLLTAMAGNPQTPLRDLRRIIDETPAELSVLAAVYCAQQATGRLRELAVRRFLGSGGRIGAFYNEVADPDRPDWMGLVAAAFEPALFLRTLRHLRSAAPEDDLIAAYALVARQTGAEPVWVAEQERAGSLDRMLPAVRESMLAGDAGPVVAAAETAARSSRAARVPTEMVEGWPLEDLVRARLDGRPERWAELTGFVAAGVREPWPDLIRMCGTGSGPSAA